MAASDLNLVVISGRLTRDPESRGDGKVAALSVASNRYFKKNSDAETTEEVCFVDVTLFGYEAEAVLSKLRKGAPVTIEGRLELNRWQNGEGENRQMLRIVGNRLHSSALRNGNGNGEQTVSEHENNVSRAAVEAPVTADPTGDDIPF